MLEYTVFSTVTTAWSQNILIARKQLSSSSWICALVPTYMDDEMHVIQQYNKSACVACVWIERHVQQECTVSDDSSVMTGDDQCCENENNKHRRKQMQITNVCSVYNEWN